MAKVGKNISKFGESEAEGSSQLKHSGQKIKITCLLCCRLIFQRIQPVVEEEKIKRKRNAIIKNLCDELHLSRDETPGECLEEMFPLCKGCCEESERLWEYNEEIKRIQEKKEATLLEIRRTVTEGEVFQSKIRNPNPLQVEAETKKFKRLREVVLKANRVAWKKDSQNNDGLIDESSNGNEDIGTVTQNQEPITTATPIGVTLVNDFNPIAVPRKCTSSASRGNNSKDQNAMDKKCVFCAKTFPNKSALMPHLLSHTREKPYICNVCGTEFGQNAHLTTHIAIHTGEKPFKCNLCFKTFSLKYNLESHLRTHTRERPFKCNVCYKTFIHKGSLRYHLKTHARK